MSLTCVFVESRSNRLQWRAHNFIPSIKNNYISNMKLNRLASSALALLSVVPNVYSQVSLSLPLLHCNIYLIVVWGRWLCVCVANCIFKGRRVHKDCVTHHVHISYLLLKCTSYAQNTNSLSILHLFYSSYHQHRLLAGVY